VSGEASEGSWRIQSCCFQGLPLETAACPCNPLPRTHPPEPTHPTHSSEPTPPNPLDPKTYTKTNHRLAYNLRELILVNNTNLVGRLPDEAAGLAQLRRVGLFGTGLSCVPNEMAEAALEAAANGKQAPVYRCPKGDVLPCFLEFAPYEIPRSDDSHMLCRPVRRKQVDAVVESCPAAAAPANTDPSGDVLESQWDLPPSYYQFQNCRCLSGYQPVWSKDGTALRCILDKRAALPPWMWVFVALGASLVLLAVSLLVLGSRWALFKSRWVREAELKRKRRLGMPREGSTVCVVITDVEGYSSECRAFPLGAVAARVL